MFFQHEYHPGSLDIPRYPEHSGLCFVWFLLLVTLLLCIAGFIISGKCSPKPCFLPELQNVVSLKEERALLIQRSDPTPVAPIVCLAFVSNNRPEYLARTVHAMLKHMEEFEDSLPYEVVWVDQATDEVSREIIAKSYQVYCWIYTEVTN